MCAFDSALNFDEIGLKRLPLVAFGLRPNATANVAISLFLLFFLAVFSDFQMMPRNSRILPITFLELLNFTFLGVIYVIENVRKRGSARIIEILRHL